MSATEKAEGKQYDYSVSAKTEARVRRVFGKGAEDVLKKLRVGHTVGKGPHTFRPCKEQILPKAKTPPGESQADNTQSEAGGEGKIPPPSPEKSKK